ncbi:MAG TPA: DUF805 domain-containing protein [Rhizomicrobium sp.]|jgi:uncharacterized membrane protein YhaH (DUF805 family)|nr:DUF805 domain-containing protein [Rhizomicrobium sp.]
MSLGHYLFSFSGRVNRAKQWAILLVGLAFEIAVVALFSTVVGWAAIGHAVDDKTPFLAFIGTPQFRTFLLLTGALYLLSLYISIAVMTKRLHDRNKAAWWLLVFLGLPILFNIPRYLEAIYIFNHLSAFIAAAQHNAQRPLQESPIAILGGGIASIISLWAFVELFCLRGTVGDNRYGPDPLAARA